MPKRNRNEQYGSGSHYNSDSSYAAGSESLDNDYRVSARGYGGERSNHDEYHWENFDEEPGPNRDRWQNRSESRDEYRTRRAGRYDNDRYHPEHSEYGRGYQEFRARRGGWRQDSQNSSEYEQDRTHGSDSDVFTQNAVHQRGAYEPYVDNDRPYFTGEHSNQVHEGQTANPRRYRTGNTGFDRDYTSWRSSELDRHDRDYQIWRNAQARNYDPSYSQWRQQRQEKFDKEFNDWRTSQSTLGQTQMQGGQADNLIGHAHAGRARQKTTKQRSKNADQNK